MRYRMSWGDWALIGLFAAWSSSRLRLRVLWVGYPCRSQTHLNLPVYLDRSPFVVAAAIIKAANSLIVGGVTDIALLLLRAGLQRAIALSRLFALRPFPIVTLCIGSFGGGEQCACMLVIVRSRTWCIGCEGLVCVVLRRGCAPSPSLIGNHGIGRRVGRRCVLLPFQPVFIFIYLHQFRAG